MRKKYIIFIFLILILLLLLPRIKTLRILFNGFERLEKVEAPRDIQNLFLKGTSIEYFESRTYKDSNDTLSVFKYRDSLGVMVFKRKVPSGFDLRSINISEQNKIKMTPNEFYWGSIYLENLMYCFGDESMINTIEVLGSHLTEKSLERNTEKELYLVFYIDEYFGLKFNEMQKNSLFAQSISPRKDEYNELLIKKNEEYLYFIYLKPLRSIENQEKEILRKLVKF